MRPPGPATIIALLALFVALSSNSTASQFVRARSQRQRTALPRNIAARRGHEGHGGQEAHEGCKANRGLRVNRGRRGSRLLSGICTRRLIGTVYAQERPAQSPPSATSA